MVKFDKQASLDLNCIKNILFFICIVIFIPAFLYSERKLFALNSDILYLPSLFKDIALRIPISEWIFPPSPYFFPDGVIFAITRLFTSSYLLSLAISGVIISLFGFLGWVITLRKFSLGSQYIFTLFFLICLLLCGVYVGGLDISPVSFVITQHFGITALFPYFCLMIYRYILSSKYLFLILITVLDILIFISDPLSIILIISILLSAIILCRLRNINNFLKLYLSFLLSLIIAHFIRQYFIRIGNLPDVNLFNLYSISIYTTLKKFLLYLSLLYQSKKIPVIFISILFGISFCYLYHERKRLNISIYFLGLSSLFCVILNLGIVLYFRNFIDVMCSRYLQPAMSVSIFFSIILITNFLTIKIKKERSVIILSLILICLSVFIISKNFYKRIFLQNFFVFYPPLEYLNCVANTSAKNGAGGYWDAKYFYILSSEILKKDMFVVALKPDLNPYFWITNTRHYKDFPPANFLLLEDNQKGRVLEMFGKPNNQMKCGKKLLYLYSYPNFLDFYLKNTCNSFKNIGDKGMWLGRFFYTEIGKRKGPTLIAENRHSGFLAYGPYISLPAGKYVLKIFYKCNCNSNTNARWDIFLNATKKLDEGILKCSSTSTTIKFTLNTKNIVEFRIFYLGKGKFILKKMILRRVA